MTVAHSHPCCRSRPLPLPLQVADAAAAAGMASLGGGGNLCGAAYAASALWALIYQVACGA